MLEIRLIMDENTNSNDTKKQFFVFLSCFVLLINVLLKQLFLFDYNNA